MPSFINFNKKNCFLFITLIFIFSLILRLKYIGTLSDGHHQFSTAQLLLYVENWFYEGIKKNNFLSIWIPESIDYIELKDRVPYVSYPIGSQLIIYFLKLIFFNFNTLKIIHITSALVHFLIITTIFFFISKIQFNLKSSTINIFASIASISYIFFPSAFYYHLMLFNYDTLIILPFILILFLEYLIRTEKNKLFPIAQSILLMLAGYIDYFAYTIAATLFIFRYFFPKKNYSTLKNIIQIIIPIAIPFCIHIYHIHVNGFLELLFQRFTLRTGISQFLNIVDKRYDSFFYNFWIKKLNIYLPLIILSIFFLYKNFTKDKNKFNIACLVVLLGYFSCFLISLVLQDHAAIHDFSALKFYPLIAITIFALIPLKFIEFKNTNKLLKKNIFINLFKYLNQKIIIGFTIFLLLFMVILDNSIRYFWLKSTDNPYLNINNQKILKSFLYLQFPDPKINHQEFSNFIKQNSNYNDIYLSFTDFYIVRNPPQKLSIARKIVKKIYNTEMLKKEIYLIPNRSTLKIIVNKSNTCKDIFKENEKKFFDNYLIVKINTDQYNDLYKCL